VRSSPDDSDPVRGDESPILEVRGVSKTFPGVRALADVDFDLLPGEVHALVGENGAGKSTLIKILAGALRPDTGGQILLRGAPVSLASPRAAMQLGISAVHQEFTYCPDLDVAENLFMGHSLPETRLRLVNWTETHRRARELISRLGTTLDVTVPMRQLSASNRKVVEIARGLTHHADVLILDEPTAALPENEIESFFGVIRLLRSMNVAVIYISHHLDEVFQIADRITVLRDGHKVATLATNQTSREELISLMVGRSLSALFPRRTEVLGEPALRVTNLTRHGAFRDITFTLRRGEILGLAGLVGAGRSEIGQALAGIYPADGGDIFRDGMPLRVRNVQDAMGAGIVYVPEERQRQGLVLNMSVVDNITLPSVRQIGRFFLSRREQMRRAQEYRDRLRIICASLRQPVQRLSGGNQQKCVLSKWIMTQPKVLIVDEPTRGIDVGAKAAIHALIGELADGGMGVLMISSELPELIGMCDRILVLCEGRISREIPRAEFDQRTILRAATEFVQPQQEGHGIV